MRFCVALQVSSDELSAHVMGLHEAGCTRSGKALSDDSDQYMKGSLSLFVIVLSRVMPLKQA